MATDQKIRRGVGRTLTNSFLLIVSLAVIGGWISTGFYELELGQAAIIMRLGAYHTTQTREGLNWHWPEPLEYSTVLSQQAVRTEVFGMAASEGGAAERAPGDAGTQANTEVVNFVQTADNNIVNVSYELQYRVKDAYSFYYGMARPRKILYEATQAAVREVIGRKAIDDVLLRNRTGIELEAKTILEATLTSYFVRQSGGEPYDIDKINLQSVHAPEQVRAAFQDVVAAQQDERRAQSRATGDAREIVERARAEAAELRESAEGYKEAKILESGGESARFVALLAEYRRAPEVTRRRLYLETMESLLPHVEKMIIEPETVNVMPFMATPGRRMPSPSTQSAAKSSAEAPR